MKLRLLTYVSLISLSLTLKLFCAELLIWDRNRLNGALGGYVSSEKNPGWYYENWFLGKIRFGDFYISTSNEAKVSFKYSKLSSNQFMAGPGYRIAKYFSTEVLGYYTYNRQIAPAGFSIKDDVGVCLQLEFNANLSKKFFLHNRIRFFFNIQNEKYIRLCNMIILKYKLGVFYVFAGDEVYYHLDGEDPLNLNFAFLGVGISPLKFISFDISAGIKSFNYEHYYFMRFDVIIKF
jgi:hypothetical protein